MRRAFTLVELLVAIAILTILAAVAMSALGNLEEHAKAERTRTIIKRIDGYIMEKWQSYNERPLPLRLPSNVTPPDAAVIRLRAVRDLMRMELPERATDVDPKIGPNPGNPVPPYSPPIDPVRPVDLGYSLPSGNSYGQIRMSPPSAFMRYYRIINSLSPLPWAHDPSKNSRDNWADTYAQSELLYLILAGMRDADSSPLDFLSPSEIGDTDGDGLKEVLDGWGQPIWFMRWAPGYTQENGANTLQSVTVPDPFDPMRADPSGYSLRPLLVSGGPDRLIDLFLEYNLQNDPHQDIRYADPGAGNPHYPLKIFHSPTLPHKAEGAPDLTNDGGNYADNITNHSP